MALVGVEDEMKKELFQGSSLSLLKGRKQRPKKGEDAQEKSQLKSIPEWYSERGPALRAKLHVFAERGTQGRKRIQDHAKISRGSEKAVVKKSFFESKSPSLGRISRRERESEIIINDKKRKTSNRSKVFLWTMNNKKKRSNFEEQSACEGREINQRTRGERIQSDEDKRKRGSNFFANSTKTEEYLVTALKGTLNASLRRGDNSCHLQKKKETENPKTKDLHILLEKAPQRLQALTLLWDSLEHLEGGTED